MRAVKKLLLFPLLISAALLLSSCMELNSADLFCLPRLIPEYDDLLAKINDMTSGTRWKIAGPRSGENRDTVQFVDFYDDGIEEAVIFLENSADYQLRLVIFTRTGDDSFGELLSFDISGNQFQTVEYADFNGDGLLDIVFSASTGTSSQYTLCALNIINGEAQSALTALCTGHAVFDINGDGRPEIISINSDETGQNAFAELFRPSSDALLEFVSAGRAPLSSGVRSALHVSKGQLFEGCGALIIEGFNRETREYVSDVIVASEGGLQNVTFSAVDGYSKTTGRMSEIFSADIDGDGFLEIPLVQHMPRPENTPLKNTEPYYKWFRIDEKFTMRTKLHTYNSAAGDWFLALPAPWLSYTVYAETSPGPNSLKTVFYVELSRFQYELASFIAYRGSSPYEPDENAKFVVSNRGYDLYIKLPSEQSLSNVPPELRVTEWDLYGSIFTFDSAGGAKPVR